MLCSNIAFGDWDGGIEAGTVLGGGDGPALRFYASHTGDPLSHYVYLDWIREAGSSSYRLGYNPSFAISHSLYSFGEFSIEKDDPDDIARETSARVGLANHLFRTRNSRFTIRAGIGGTQVELADGEKKDPEGYLFAGGLFTTKLIGLLRFDAVAETTTGDAQTITDAEAGVSLRIGPNTALKYAHTYKQYSFDNRDDVVSKDSFLTVTYGF